MLMLVSITLQSPLHIGALAPAGTAAIKGMVKDARGWPYIPASTFKGRLRHAVEQLVRAFELPVCKTHLEMCRDQASACQVCRLFGSPWLPGRIRFGDLQLSEPEFLVKMAQSRRADDHPPRPSQRYGVGISRMRKVSADNLLYTIELFQPGMALVFSGRVEGPMELIDAAWLMAGLAAMRTIGGNRTRGLGWIEAVAEISDGDRQILPNELLQELERVV